MDKLIADVQEKAKIENVKLSGNIEENALINGLFAQVGWKFLANRNNPSAFESKPNAEKFFMWVVVFTRIGSKRLKRGCTSIYSQNRYIYRK